jgi:hypothetical protein
MLTSGAKRFTIIYGKGSTETAEEASDEKTVADP